jgi:hypothetical protein
VVCGFLGFQICTSSTPDKPAAEYTSRSVVELHPGAEEKLLMKFPMKTPGTRSSGPSNGWEAPPDARTAQGGPVATAARLIIDPSRCWNT